MARQSRIIQKEEKYDKEDFVSLEIAELLDKCHFNEPCRAKYAIFGDKKPVFAEVKNFVFECYTNRELKNHFTENEKYYAHLRCSWQ